MFGFIGKFKGEVVAGFDSIHQRLITLEAQVAALFEHTKQVAAQDAEAAKTTAEAAVTTVEAVAPVTQAIETVEADAKQV